jgi:hypothetical protein
MEVRRQYAPDRKLVVHALRRLLREPKQGALETMPVQIPIRGPTVLELRAEATALEQG